MSAKRRTATAKPESPALGATQSAAQLGATIGRLSYSKEQEREADYMAALILYLLAMNEGQVIPYTRLVSYAWSYEGGDASLLKTHICHIRKKLALNPSGKRGIKAVLGVGYSLSRG